MLYQFVHSFYLVLLFSLNYCSVRSPRLRSRSSSLSIGRTGSSTSLSGDDVFTVETLQLSRFDPTPDEPEEEPDYGPTDIALRPSEELKSALLVRAACIAMYYNYGLENLAVNLIWNLIGF